MPRERILILVKTYPTLSSSYGELVCTAGMREDGSWIRIYPIPFRQIEAYKQYEKFRIVEATVMRNTKDPRPESYKVDLEDFRLTETILPAGDYRERRNWILKKGRVFTNRAKLVEENRSNGTSLATFKPTRVLDLKFESASPSWSLEKLGAIAELAKQGTLFTDWKLTDPDNLIKKLPWKFSYHFEDDEGAESTLMIEDWEIGQLYWRMLEKYRTETLALEKVRQKYIDEFLKTDLHLFLGTTRQFDGWASNPFIITGVFRPPINLQEELF